MKRILFISHRMPYPPNKGDKIRAFSILQSLKQLGHNVSIAFTVDDKKDLRHIDYLKNEFNIVHFSNISKFSSYYRVLKSFFSSKPASIAYFDSKDLRQKINKQHNEERFDIIFYYSGASLNYYIYDTEVKNIIDFVDADSIKWLDYSKNYYFPLSLFFSYEAKKLGKYEQNYLKKSSISLFVSKQEASLFNEKYLIPKEISKKTTVLENIVDTEFFSPDVTFDNPYDDVFPEAVEHICIFTGQMDYAPNIEAVIFFVRNILPKLSEEFGYSVGFVIAGRKPTKDIINLGQEKNIHVTGEVEDIRPYILHSNVSVCPLLTARGIQNKILEAMACSKPVIATSGAFEGIKAIPLKDLFIADSIDDWIFYLRELFNNPSLAQRIGESSQDNIQKHYSKQNMDNKVGEIVNDF